MRKLLKIKFIQKCACGAITIIGLVISVSDEWQEMGDKIIDKL